MQQYREYRISPVPENLVPVPVFPLQAAYTIMQQRRLATSSALRRISLTGRPPAFQPPFYLLMIGKLRLAVLKPLHGLMDGHYLPRLFQRTVVLHGPSTRPWDDPWPWLSLQGAPGSRNPAALRLFCFSQYSPVTYCVIYYLK